MADVNSWCHLRRAGCAGRRLVAAACTCLLSLFSIGAVAARPDREELRVPTIGDLLAIDYSAVSLDLSPTGTSVAYSLSSEQGHALWLIQTEATAKPVRIGNGFLPRWSPRADAIAFYSDEGADGIQLWVFDVVGQRARQVTHIAGGINPEPDTRFAGPVRDAFSFDWSSDGRKLVFASRVEDTPEPSDSQEIVSEEMIDEADLPLVLTSRTPPEWTLSGVYAHPSLNGASAKTDGYTIQGGLAAADLGVSSSQLFLADIKTGHVRRLTRGQRHYFHPAWAPDGKTIACATASGIATALAGNAGQAIDIATVDAATGDLQLRTQGPGVRIHPSWSPDGVSLAFLGADDQYLHSGIFVGRVIEGTFKQLAHQLDRNIDSFAWAPDSRSIYLTYQNGLSHPLARLRLDSLKLEELDVDGQGSPHSDRDISLSKRGALAWIRTDYLHPQGLLSWKSAKAPRSKIALVDLFPTLRQWRVGSIEPVYWKTGRGESKEGTLLKPLNYVEGERYPLIVDAYPTAGGFNWLSPMMSNVAWSSMGYAVFRPSPRAPHDWMNAWKSEAFDLAAKGKHGWEVTLDDILSGVDELIARGLVDPERMCLYGFSNGATVVDYVVTRSHRFKCAVSVSGALSDWVSPVLLNTSAAAQLSAMTGTTLWDDPQTYLELSAVFRAHHVRTPMLLAVGDQDDGFLEGSIRMYNALRHAGQAPVTLLRYPGQEHGFQGNAMADFWRRETAFFAQHLGTQDVYSSAASRSASRIVVVRP